MFISRHKNEIYQYKIQYNTLHFQKSGYDSNKKERKNTVLNKQNNH